MKRFLLLMLVLTVASLANATLVLDTTYDGTRIYEGETISVNIYSDAPMTAFEAHTWALIVTNGALGAVSGGEPVAIPNLSNTIIGAVEDTPSVLNPAGSVGLFGGTLWASFTSSLEPTVIYEDFVYTCLDHGSYDAIIELWELTDIGNDTWEFTTLTDSLMIDQDIPEPMTLALLGIGGLFLRRRR